MKKQTLIMISLLVILSGGIIFAMTSSDHNKESKESENSKSISILDTISEEETIPSKPSVIHNSDTKNVTIEDSKNIDDVITSFQTVKDMSENNSVVIYFFWGDGCPHCANQKPFLEEMEKKYSELEVKMFEVYRSKNNQKLFQEIAQAYGIQARGVPATFIGDFEPIIGFGTKETTGVEIENRIKQCIEDSCISPEKKL